MSVSRKSSFDTIVEKGRDPLQFLASPEHFREQLNLKGLSESAGKSFDTLKRWQRATSCFDHNLVQTIMNNIVEQGDNSHSAIKKTLANAQQGRAFAEGVVVLCDALAEKQNTPENLGELVQNLITIAEKAHRRSIKARDQLKGVCDKLSEISKDLTSQVSKIESDTLIATADPDDDAMPSFNGVNTCFVAFPLKVPVAELPNPFGIQDNSDSDDEDAVPVGPGPIGPVRCGMITRGVPSWTKPKHMTFANVEVQLTRIIHDVSTFMDRFERCVDWWAGMKAGLDSLKDALPQIKLPVARTWTTSEVTRGWNEVADQFSLYFFKTTPFVNDYFPNPRMPGEMAGPFCGGSPWIPPPMHWAPASTNPAPAPQTDKPQADKSQTDKPKPLWKRLCCIL